MRKVIGMGETIMDILFRNNQPIAAVPGGSCFNTIVSLGRTGIPSVFLGYTGGDVVGQQTVEFLKENGVSTDFFELREDEKSAISLAMLNEQGDANYLFYKTPPNAKPDTVIPDFASDDVLLFGSYYASSPGTRDYIRKVLTETKKAGVIVYYDLNFRKSHQHELEQLMPALIENFEHSNIVRGSADDFEIMYGERDARTIYEKHIARYCKTFICTSGPGLITVCTQKEAYDFPVPTIEAVSTVGAGDNFNAGFIYGLIQNGIKLDELGSLPKDTWTRLIETGCAFAAQVCQSEQNSISREFANSLSR